MAEPMPPPPGAPPRVERQRPWWGMGDVVLGLAVVFLASTVGTFLTVPFLSPQQQDALFADELDVIPDLTLVVSLVVFQVAMWAWPVIVARWKGFGATHDFGFWMRPVDLGIGLLTAIVVFLAAAGVNVVMSNLVGLDTGAEEATNTEILTDASDRALLWLVAAAVIGAPIVEELFFRGLCLRAIQKRAGTVVAVIGSTVLFVLPHFTFSTSAGTIVLFATVGTVGLILAIVAVWIGRLGPTMVAHSLFNIVGVVGALAT